MKRSYHVIVERDEDGYYVATVPHLPGCHTQARTLDELIKRAREAVELYLEVEKNKSEPQLEFVGIQKVEVSVR